MFKYRIKEDTVTYQTHNEILKQQTFYTIQRSRCGSHWEAVWDTIHQDQAVSRVRSWQKEQGQSAWETVAIVEQPA